MGSHASLVVAFLLVSSGVVVEQRVAASCRHVPERCLEAFDASGPHPVGVRTATFVGASRPTPPAGSFAGAPERTLVTEVWYPALAPGRHAALDAAGGDEKRTCRCAPKEPRVRSGLDRVDMPL